MTSKDGLTFSHMGLFVSDIAKMAHFYTEVLGMTVTDHGDLVDAHGNVELVFLSRDPNNHHQIALVSGRPAHIPFNVINQISFSASSVEVLQDFFKRVRREAVEELVAVTHGISFSVYFKDPEGNRVELFVDTPWYVTQPARVTLPIDLPVPELMVWAEAHARTLEGFRPRDEWAYEMAGRMTKQDQRRAMSSKIDGDVLGPGQAR
jgi:catechol-2,3-dioxygenase